MCITLPVCTALVLAGCGASAPSSSSPPRTAPAEPEAQVAAAPAPVDAAIIEQHTGATPAVSEDGVAKVTWSREDVAVRVDGGRLPPEAGLTSWAAFTGMPGGGAMVMGDTVVFEDEVDAAMDAAFAHGLEVTALHNHFFFDEPDVYFMHVGGRGESADLAEGVRAVWNAIRAIREETPEPAHTFDGDVAVTGGGLDADALGEALGLEPTLTDPDAHVVKFSVGREGEMHGVRVGGSMGLTSWAAFHGSDAAATVDGDLIMAADEVQPVLRALRREGLHVVALHNHMVGGEPFYYFVHYWGAGPALELARSLRPALDVVRER